MGTPYFIPQAQNDFNIWQDNFYNRVLEKLNSFKLEDSTIKGLTATKSNYDKAFGRANNPDSANRADRVELKLRTAEYRQEIRLFNNEHLRFNSNVSDYDRKYLGLNIADTTPTPAAVPDTHPDLSVDFSESLHHTLHIKDDKLDSKRKPAGVKECEIWYKISDEKPKVEELQYAGTSSKATFFMEFSSDNEGKRVWYRARWINTRGEHGRWGVYASAIIA